MIHRELAQCEDQFNAGEITATNLLDVASRIYGKALDKRVKEMKEKLIEDIESQAPELLEQAVQVEQENEEAVRQETENTEWHCDEEIVLFVRFVLQIIVNVILIYVTVRKVVFS